jgi:hypothetical protein
VSNHHSEHQALTAALATPGPDLGNMFTALDNLGDLQLRRLTTACEWLAMHGRGELDNRRRMQVETVDE